MSELLSEKELNEVSGGMKPPFFIYTVKAGDMLTSIAVKFGISYAELMKWNKDKFPNPDVIEIGDEILIPNN